MYAIGAQNGYLLKIDDNFERILILSRSLHFTPYFENFRLLEDNSLEGNIKLTIFSNKISQDQRKELLSLGFIPSQIPYEILTYTTRLNGTRYQTEGDISYKKIEEKITIDIALPRRGTETAYKMLLTPGAVATDASIMAISLPAVTLMVLVMATDNL